MAPSTKETAYIYHHVVLPPKLPQEDDYDPAHERVLVELVVCALSDLKDNVDRQHCSTVQSAIETIENFQHCRDNFGNISDISLETLLVKCARGHLDGIVPLEAKNYWNDLGSEIIHITSAKLHRRLRKLRLSKQASCLKPEWAQPIKKDIASAHAVIKKQWLKVTADPQANIDTAIVKRLRPEDDLDMNLPALDTFLSEAAARKRNASSTEFEPSSTYPRYDSSEFPDTSFGTGNHKIFCLAAFETWVEKYLKTWTQQHAHDPGTCGKLRRIMESYHTNAYAVYSDVPISLSIMYLTLVEIWVACDESACSIHPLLLEYDPETDLAELQCLVLPLKTQLERLHNVEVYVSSRRVSARKSLPSVYRQFGDPSSFAVRYFDGDVQLQSTLAQIERKAAQKRQQKCQELARLQEQYQSLMHAYNTGVCQTETYIYNRRFGYTTTRHRRDCSRCAKSHKAEALSIQIYEWPVSSQSAVAKATVFELHIPRAFGDWRDSSAYMVASVLGFKADEASKPSYKFTLDMHSEISSLLSKQYHERRIIPLSTIKPHSVTHRKNKQAVHLLNESDVCLKNAMRLEYYDRSLNIIAGRAPIHTEDVAKKCRYKLPQRSKALERFAYKPPSLSDGLGPNEVIVGCFPHALSFLSLPTQYSKMASLSDCPLNISIEEYKALTSIPLGSRIVYSNIITQLAIPAVDFTKPETQCFILQAAQQVGKPNGHVERVTHDILTEEKFGYAMLHQLNVALERMSENWESWRAVATLSLLAKRVYCLNDSVGVRTQALEILVRIREVCMKWVSRLKQRVAASTDNNQRSELCSRATEIALICTDTYDVADLDFDAILRQESAVSTLLKCSIMIQENSSTVQSDYQSLYNCSLQAWKSMMYRIFPKLQAYIQFDKTGLEESISTNWAAFQPASTAHWVSLATPREHWVYVQSGTLPVHFNLVTGELLVNGLPLARLPQVYSDHSMYAPLFARSTLEVVPTDELGLEFGAKAPYHGFSLHFGMKNEDMLVVAIKNSCRWDLLPQRVFQHQLPHSFVSDYTHWYNHSNQIVEFRPRSAPWSIEDDMWRLQHDIGTSTWRLVKTDEVLVHRTSTSARGFSTIFQSLEDENHIHIILNIMSRVVDIELPRLQLSFFIGHREAQIQSRQYRGMFIDSEQSIGSLVGLNSKLVLKHQSDRTILIPWPSEINRNTVQYQRMPNLQHTKVSISKTATTKVYAYAIDEDLGRIIDTGDMESKLFLSLLHALTSHCLPDKLTKTTGVESSLTILRSAATRSFKYLTETQVKLLEYIGLLSAKRAFYPSHLRVMQEINWNAALPSSTQDPYLRTAVGAIFDHAMSMSLFYPESTIYNSIRKSREAMSSDALLEHRNIIRTAVFRVSGFGAEDFTTSLDKTYNARDSGLSTPAALRAHQTMTMTLRDREALLSAIPNIKGSLLGNHFQSATVAGIDPSFQPSRLGYDAKWLEDPTPFLVKNWCSLHQHLPGASSRSNRFNIAVWLATMSYAKSADVEVIQTLFAFYRLRDFAGKQPPTAPKFELPRGNTYDKSEIRTIAQVAAKSFDTSAEANLPILEQETEEEHDLRMRSTFEHNRSIAIKGFAANLQLQWPIQRPTTPKDKHISTYIELGEAMEKVKDKFRVWYDNREFHNYLQSMGDVLARQTWTGVPCANYVLSSPEPLLQLSDKIRTFGPDDIFATAPETGKQLNNGLDLLTEECTISKPNSGFQASLKDLCKDLESYAQSKCEKTYVDDLRTSCAALDRHFDDNKGQKTLTEGVKDRLLKYQQDCRTYLDNFTNTLSMCAMEDNDYSGAQYSVRISRLFWLSQLHRNRFDTLSDAWKCVIIDYGLAVTHLRRAQRLMALADRHVDLAEELRHVGHTNWYPQEHPETLLLEAESGIMVREEQEFIANKMRSEGGDNIVLQLLMGGGKSTTIVPMLSAYFSDKKKLARVIVAKPQSQQMQQMLISKLGGLLNRRIFHMPFSRNLKMTLATATAIHKLYTECVASQGVLLVLPEQILSFRLMAIECMLTDEPAIAKSLFSTQTFFEETCRDIVDESDENFSVKFELIYTEGAQQAIEFAPERWLIIQEIMNLLPRYAAKIHAEQPDTVDIQGEGDGKFPRIRLLHKDAADQLIHYLATHIVEYGIAGLPCRSQSPDMQAAILKYIKKTELDTLEIEAVEKSKFWTESTRLPLLLVRGLLACGVLSFVLTTKRWRINYGRDASREPATNLAVPYRSKDAPSPRSEFSHIDVVILLTLLSYSYGGLSDEELFDTLTHLLSSDQANIHYDEFVSTASSTLPSAFRQLSGLSIRDRHQCVMEIFPALRHSKKAIDYFLSYLVFPKQLKQFPSKLSNSSWNLGMKKAHPLSGFSGTNDTLHLLPLDVKHLDLPSQSHTNAQVLAFLLQEETSVKLLPPRSNIDKSDGQHLLNVVEQLNFDIRVVLDCGGYIMEQSNKQVAKTWLNMSNSDIQAVVYFQDEELSVLDRSGRVESFQTSPFAKNLEVCMVYLDEAHTRGTDLKLPRDYRAAVTLGSQLTKDRLAQACMRLRKLGHGQSVTFIVPEEIAIKIRKLTHKSTNEAIQVKDVLCWCISETWQDLKRSMPLWAVQGHRFEHQRDLLNGVDTTKDQAEAFLEPEAQDLESRYKPKAKEQDTANNFINWDLSNPNLARIVSRCRDFEAMGFSAAALSEEQERELSPEIEQERQVERPQRMTAEKHSLHPDLHRLASSGNLVLSSEAYEPAFQTLRSTSAARVFKLSSLPSDLLVTKDFARTVKLPRGSTHAPNISDSYQRSIQFVLSVPNGTDPGTVQNLIIISPYEADKLLPTILCSKKITLHLFASRPNASFRALDDLVLYNVGHAFTAGSVSRSLTMQLNIFAGSLYLRSISEYNELCDYLGLLRTKARADQNVWADGFIDPPCGLWKLEKSPVSFLKVLLMKIRHEGEGVEKTHLGKILNGIRLEECDFEEH
ncbi:hypothetical protein IAQ61_005991 [Plenodomus lingam]|uniref:uncharacterized protein n=1 Tax=Leptosphaeria maculans TaxID=5022 RepID=UPI0033325E75|nr:hypothetical protein IAQ61_005991 [Plenodomus lingam]